MDEFTYDLLSRLAAIADRWDGYERWCAPLRNRLWIETPAGQPIAAVTCTPEEVVAGELERRRQALAHAPEDVQALLQAVRMLACIAGLDAPECDRQQVQSKRVLRAIA